MDGSRKKIRIVVMVLAMFDIRFCQLVWWRIMLVLCKFATQFVFHQLVLYAYSCLFKIITLQTCRKEVKSLRRRMGLVARGTFMCKLKNACRVFFRRISRGKTALGLTHRCNNIKMWLWIVFK